MHLVEKKMRKERKKATGDAVREKFVPVGVIDLYRHSI